MITSLLFFVLKFSFWMHIYLQIYVYQPHTHIKFKTTNELELGHYEHCYNTDTWLLWDIFVYYKSPRIWKKNTSDFCISSVFLYHVFSNKDRLQGFSLKNLYRFLLTQTHDYNLMAKYEIAIDLEINKLT